MREFVFLDPEGSIVVKTLKNLISGFLLKRVQIYWLFISAKALPPFLTPMVVDVAEERDNQPATAGCCQDQSPVLRDNDINSSRRLYALKLWGAQRYAQKSGEPFIFHPLTVAEICVEEIGLEQPRQSSALIHDVVEDTDIELVDIERMFRKNCPHCGRPHKIRGRVWLRNISRGRELP